MLIGAGVQGGTDFARLDRVFDSYLILSPDAGYIAGLGGRAWLRPMHSVTPSQPGADAGGVITSMFLPYHQGCRNVVFPNEWIAVEGPAATPDNYRRLNEWGVKFVEALRDSAAASDMPELRIWGPALSPGHQEDDGFEGYRLLADYLSALDGIAAHYYWRPDGGFLRDPDALWWSRRIELARAVLLDIGIDRPMAVTEFNRKVDRSSGADVANYCQQVRDYYAYLAGLGYVEAAFTFLATCSDSAFDDLTLDKMSGALDRLDGLKSQVRPSKPPAPAPAPIPTPGGFVFDGSFEAKRVAAKAKWAPLNNRATDENGDSVQDYQEMTGSKRFGILREYAAEPGRVYRYWADKRDL